MLLIIIIKILFSLIVIRYSIAAESYCINHKTKKTNHRGPGNWRMPKEVALALIEGYKIKVHPGSGSTHIITEETKADSQTCHLTRPPNINFTLTHLFSKKRNRKRKLFPFLKTGNNNYATHSKWHPVLKTIVKNDSVVSTKSFNTKFTRLTNSKNSEVIHAFPEKVFACQQ